MLPISICCLVFGFFVIRFRQKVLNKTAKAYCWTVAIFDFTSWLIALVWKLSTNHSFDLPGILYIFLDAIRISTLTYYRIKCVNIGNVLIDILEVVNHMDERLDSAGIKVRHTRNLIVCILYTTFTISMQLAVWYLIYVKTQLTETCKALQESASLYNHLLKYFTYESFLFFLLYFVFVVNCLGQRLRLVCCKIEKFKETHVWMSAWERGTTFSAVGCSESLTIRKHDYLKEIQILQSSIYDTFCNTNSFYNFFFISCLWFSVLHSSISILLMAIDSNIIFLILLFINPIQFSVIPISVCVFAANEFQRINAALYRLCHTNNCNSFNRILKALYYSCFHAEKYFDSGYFKMELMLLCVLYNFVPLFVFAMFPT